MRLLICAFRYKKKDNISDLVSKSLGFPRYLLLTHKDIPALIRYIKRNEPEYILGMGQSKKGHLIRIERTATNTLVVHGKTLVKSTGKLHATLRLQQIQGTRVCHNAGTRLCNYTFYMLLEHFKSKPNICFLHIPGKMNTKKATLIVSRILKAVQVSN